MFVLRPSTLLRSVPAVLLAAAPAWTPQSSGVNARLRGVSAVTAEVAWATGAQGTILRTLDGGHGWKRRPIPGTEQLDFRDVDAFSDQLAYVLSIGPGEASRIYKTTDGGLSWVLQHTNRDPKAFFDSMAFWSPERGIVVSDTGAVLFSGRLGDRLDVHGGGNLNHALETASAGDILEALPEGLDAVVAERGRTFSGGQRQRLVLARALTADPEILVLVEPTSAVDAHTEARIAARLAAHRAGRTTVLMTASPLLLDHADHVVFLDGGVVVAEGSHHRLLRSCPAYRSTVTRGEDD